LAALGGLSALLAAPAAWSACALQQMEIPVRIVDQRPIATLTLNGTTVQMLVDSGAFFSMLGASTATQLGLPLRNLPWGMRLYGYTGEIDARLTSVDQVGLRGTRLSKVDFIVGGNELGAGIQGVLGRNILAVADTEYDLAHGIVRLVVPQGECGKTELAYWAGDAPVVRLPLVAGPDGSNTAIHVNVRINGQDSLAMLDTGATRTSLTLQTARRAGMRESELTPTHRAGGAGEGLVRSWTGDVALFELGGEKIGNSRLTIDDVKDANQDVLVGLDYFLSHRIYVSRLQRQVYVTWNGGPVFAMNRAAESADDARYAARPQPVAPDNADALARRGAAALAAGNHARALEDLNRACELAPAMAECFASRANVHLALRDQRAALADLDRALTLAPSMAESRHLRARLLAAQDNRSGALADLGQLDAGLPPSHGLRADMGIQYAALGQTADALRQFDLWVGTHPQDARLASVLNERCWLRARRNLDLPLALRDCQQAVALDKDEASYQDSLGWTHLRLGDAARAKQAFDGAIRLKRLPFSLHGRGLALQQLGDAAAADADLAAARAAQPSIADDVRQAGFDTVGGPARPAPAGS